MFVTSAAFCACLCSNLLIRVECVLVWLEVWDVVGLRFYIVHWGREGCRGVMLLIFFLSFCSHFLWVYGGRVSGIHTLTND